MADVINSQDYYSFGMVMPGRNFVSSTTYRYGYNGKEKDNEMKGDANSVDFDARSLDVRLARWMSIDPQGGRYPHLSGYSAFANCPIFYTDPGGETLFIAGKTDIAIMDLLSIIPIEALPLFDIVDNQIVINKTQYKAWLEGGIPIPSDAGTLLLIAMIESENNYLYQVSETGNDGAPLKNMNGTAENLSVTKRNENQEKENTDQPKSGYQGQVILHPNAVLISTAPDANGKDQEDNRASTVFHELKENYERTDNKLPYAYVDPNNPSQEDPNKKGAHQTAIKAAENLIPSAKSKGKEGQLKDAYIKKL